MGSERARDLGEHGAVDGPRRTEVNVDVVGGKRGAPQWRGCVVKRKLTIPHKGLPTLYIFLVVYPGENAETQNIKRKDELIIRKGRFAPGSWIYAGALRKQIKLDFEEVTYFKRNAGAPVRRCSAQSVPAPL